MYKISVIVPVYQVKEYLEECLISIVNQTFTDWEMIIVDDGSYDGSGEICDLYQSSNIKVIHQNNLGLSEARNTGIKEASGEYISFIDSDDCIEPNYLLTLITIAEQYDADIVCSKIGSFDNEIHVIDRIEVLNNQEAMKQLIIQNLYNHGVCTKLFRLSLVRKIAFPTGLTSEDVMYSYNSFKLAKTIVSINYKGYKYRIRKGSITTNTFSNSNFDLFTIMQFIDEDIKKTYPYLHNIFMDKYLYVKIYYLEKAAKQNNFFNYKKSYNMVFKDIKEDWLKFCFRRHIKFLDFCKYSFLTLFPIRLILLLDIKYISGLREYIKKIIHNPSTYVNDNIKLSLVYIHHKSTNI